MYLNDNEIERLISALNGNIYDRDWAFYVLKHRGTSAEIYEHIYKWINNLLNERWESIRDKIEPDSFHYGNDKLVIEEYTGYIISDIACLLYVINNEGWQWNEKEKIPFPLEKTDMNALIKYLNENTR